MSDKYVLLINDGLYHADGGKNMATLKEWREELIKWNGGSETFTHEDGECDVDELINMLKIGCVELYNQSMVERGDDYVECELVKLSE